MAEFLTKPDLAAIIRDIMRRLDAVERSAGPGDVGLGFDSSPTFAGLAVQPTGDLSPTFRAGLPPGLAVPFDSVHVFRDSLLWPSTVNHKIVTVYDRFNQAIGWIPADGGLVMTDGITQMQGATFLPNMRLGYGNQSQKAAPGMYWRAWGAGGGTVTHNGVAVTLDPFNDLWLRAADDGVLQYSRAIRAGWTGGIALFGPVGPLGQGGFTATNILGTGSVCWYRTASGIWRTDSEVQINGVLRIADTGADTVGLSGLTSTGIGLRIDGTLGVVFLTGNTDRWRVGATGRFVPVDSNAYDIGADTAWVRDIYLQGTHHWPNHTISESAGSPEGAVTAKPGSSVGDTTNGERWTKRTGTGNTGWDQVAHVTLPIQTIPVQTGIGQTLTGTLAGAGSNDRVWLGSGDYPVPADYKAQCRAVVHVRAHTAADVIGVALYDYASASTVAGETGTAMTVTGTTDNVERAATAWVDMGTNWRCAVQVRNQTAARGVWISAWVEVRYVLA